MVAGPVPPYGPAETAATSQIVIPGRCSRRLFFPRLSAPAGRDDCRCPARRDGGMAGPGVVSAISRDPVDGLVVGYLIQQVGEHGRVANTRPGDLDGPNFQCFRVNPEVNLAPLARL